MLRPSFVPPPQMRAVGSDPLPRRSGRRPHRRKESGRKAARGRQHQTLRRGLRHFRGIRAGDDGRPGRRGAQPQGASTAGPATMRAKITVLEEAFTGHFPDHHAFLLGTMLSRVDAISADIAAFDAQIEARSPLSRTRWPGSMTSRASARPPRSHHGRGRGGDDPFPTAGHLFSWAGSLPLCRTRPASTRATEPAGTATVTWPGSSARPRRRRRTGTFLGERYRRIARRRGEKRAIVAVGRSILVIVWHLLSDPKPATTTWPRLLRHPIDPERRTQPHPPARSPRLHRHPPARRLTTRKHHPGSAAAPPGSYRDH